MQLLKHQIEGLEFLKDKQQAGLFYEMGLGKTLIMLEHLNRTRQFPCLIVAPLSIVGVWKSEAKKFDFPFSFSILTGNKAQRLENLKQPADIYVINYEGLRVIAPQLLEKKFYTIVLDESHRCGKRQSIQTTVCLQLGATIPNRYILTGTPIMSSPIDLWSQIHFLSPGYLGNFFAFKNQYVDYRKIIVRAPGGFREVMKPFRHKNLKELHDKTELLCLRKTKNECLDLPEKIYKTIPCQMSIEQQRHYYSLKHALATMLNDKTLTVQHASTLVNKLRQVCQGFLYSDAGNPIFFKQNKKLEILKDLLQDIFKEKIIIFTYYKADMDLLRKELSDEKLFIFEGTEEVRSRVINEFQNYEHKGIFLANIETAKEGITLTSANHVMFFGNSYSYASRIQAEDRAHRHGQTKSVIYYDLVCLNSIDERVVKILQTKKHTADVITGDAMRLAQLAVEENV